MLNRFVPEKVLKDLEFLNKPGKVLIGLNQAWNSLKRAGRVNRPKLVSESRTNLKESQTSVEESQRFSIKPDKSLKTVFQSFQTFSSRNEI